jgi:folate-binding protein YgfZ
VISLPGIVPATGPDAGVAWHYGGPSQESRALSEGRAFADLSHLGVIAVTGSDRLSWLHSLTTQSLATLRPGEGVEAMVLSPQGHIEHVASVVDDGTTAWLITETPVGLAAHLDRMRFMLRVEVRDVTREWAVLGDSSGHALPFEGPPAWIDPWPGVVPGGTSYLTPGTDHPGEGWRWRLTLVPRRDLDASAKALLDEGLCIVGTWATEAARVWAWRPRALTEVDANALPHEFDWLRTAVHLDKGCYRGQETVAKVHNVGRPPRRLTFLHLDGSGHILVSLPASVLLEGEAVGHVTSVALHHEAGPIALALLKRGADPKATLAVADSDGNEVAASQVPIVNPDGVSSDRPPPPGPTARGLLMGRGCPADGGDGEVIDGVIP